jgi:CxxC motif-containing protein
VVTLVDVGGPTGALLMVEVDGIEVFGAGCPRGDPVARILMAEGQIVLVFVNGVE